MYIITLHGEVPTRIVVGCAAEATQTFERLSAHGEVSIENGPAPVRDDAEKDRAAHLVTALFAH